jgi:membrane associated rhomboid family serine protease
MDCMEDIRSENRFVWKFIWQTILTPVTFILVLLKKKELSDLFLPFSEIFRFIFEPKFTITMIIINIAAFMASVFLMSEQAVNSLVNYPSDLLSHRYYTLITAGFLHANLSHLAGNMLALFIFGRVVERKLGFFKTALIYFGALVISGLFESLVNLFIAGNNIGGLGASGALMGLVSAAILLDPFYLTYELIIPLPVMVVGWIAIYGDISGVLNPVQDGIGHFAHIGGFFSIGLLMFLIGADERAKLKKGLMINILSLVVGVMLYLVVVQYNYFGLFS